MAYNEIIWDFPQYSSYSILNAVVPGTCWKPLENNPLIAAFQVEYLDVSDGSWATMGTTASSYIRFPSDVYARMLLIVFELLQLALTESAARSPLVLSS
jgi:hypothetical protein